MPTDDDRQSRTTVRPHPRLVPHDLAITRTASALGRGKVVAAIYCERVGAEVSVDVCRLCQRFARIEPHEAGYVLLCRSCDEDAPACLEDDEPA